MVIRISALPNEASPVATEFLAIDGPSVRKTTIQAAVNAGAPVASQAEAEAGSDNSKRMTALTVKQSIASEVGDTIASAAQGALANTALQPGDVNDLVFQTIADMKAFSPVAGQVAFLNAAGREGNFKWTLAADYPGLEAAVTADTQNGLFVKADAVAASVGAWVRQGGWRVTGVSVTAFGAKVDGTTDDIAAINAALIMSALVGAIILQPVGTMMVGSTIVYRSGAKWDAVASGVCVVKKTAAHTGRMLITENFDAQTGNTDPDVAGLCESVEIGTIVFDGNWMSTDRTAYVNDAGGGGLFVYTSKRCFISARILNMCGIGLFVDAPSGNPAGNPIGFGREGRLNVYIDTTKEEGLIFRGIADRAGHVVFQLNAGARIISEDTTPAPTPRSSPTYGSVNGGLTDGVVILKGMEFSFIHAFGNPSGLCIRIISGRFNLTFFMGETGRYGGVKVEGGYGDNVTFEAHRTGGGGVGVDEDTALVVFDAPLDGNVNYSNSLISAYQKSTADTSPRPCVVFGNNARGFVGLVKTRGDNVPGHGVVVEGAADYLDITLDTQGHVGTSSDGLPSSGLYRKASSSSRFRKFSGMIRNCAVGFRSSGTPDKEDIDLEFSLAAGQTMFTGDARANPGQVWKLFGTVDSVFDAMIPRNERYAATTLVINAGAVTITDHCMFRIDTEAAAASDDLDTINGGVEGDVITFQSTNSSRDVMFKHGTGNLRLNGLVDFALNQISDRITLQKGSGGVWVQISSSNNGT